MSFDAADGILPGTDVDRPPFDHHARASVDWFEVIFRAPSHGLLGLIAARVEMLFEVSLAMEERDADDRNAEIGSGAQRVTGEHTETAAVRRDRLVERDLHREIRDRAIALNRTHQVSPNAGVGERCWRRRSEEYSLRNGDD